MGLSSIRPIRLVSWKRSTRSEILGAPFHGVVPELAAVVVEHEVGIFRYREPEALVELAFQPAGSPARISEGDQDLCRTLMMGDVAQNLALLVIARRPSISMVPGRR